MCKKGDLWAKKINDNYQLYYKFRGGLEGQMPKSIWYDAKYSASEYGTQILDSIMGSREMFQYPKSPHAVKDCILAGTNRKDALILDFFAGSGTTGHAVLELNKEDGGTRQFILCTNNENNICTEVCYPRIKKVIKGYKNSKNENIEGLGGNLKYYTCSFVEAEPTDRNKRKLVNESTEMLCIKENAFEMVRDGSDFKIFKNNKIYLGIVFYEEAIDDFKKAIKKMDGYFNTYVFSLGDDPHEKQFTDVKNKVTLCAIPEVILKVYREIFK
jgi:adenine-specific DNA-methyltransferase